jgi:serine/threonine-protein kinase Chk2
VIKENEMVYIIDLSKNGTFVNGSKIGRNQKLIIHNNDEIAVGQPNVKVYMFNCNINYDNAPPEVRRKYFISKVLGQGAFGEVRLALDKRTFEQYAIKKITKGRSSTRVIGQASHPQKIKTEVEILKSLSHPFIIKMREVFETDDSVFLILEYMKGGELTGRILSATPFPESEVKFIFYQIMLGVRYLHANGVTHRDLKPENVLLHSDGSYPLAKISDFGLSKIMENISAMETTCGTIAYVAPEVLNHLKRYNKQVDVWSLGVILFYMLSKTLPFTGPDRIAISRKILKGEILWDAKSWRGVSMTSRDLVRQMLTVDPNARISIERIFDHKWIAEVH